MIAEHDATIKLNSRKQFIVVEGGDDWAQVVDVTTGHPVTGEIDHYDAFLECEDLNESFSKSDIMFKLGDTGAV